MTSLSELLKRDIPVRTEKTQLEQALRVIQNRWYELNNTPKEQLSDREFFMLQGRKGECIYLIELLKREVDH